MSTHGDLEPWSRAFPLVGRAANPFARKVPPPGTPHIRHLRAVAIVFGSSLILILVLLLIIDDAGEAADAGPVWIWAGTLLASVIGFMSLRPAASRAVVRAPDLAAAALLYRKRMVLSIALAQVPSLAAFAVFFAPGPLTPYLISLPVSLALIAIASPGRGDVRRLGEAAIESGSTVDLTAALMAVMETPTDRSRRRRGPIR